MMTKLWRVAFHEYKRHVFKRGFILAVFSVPLIIASIVVLVLVMQAMNSDYRAVGYVDNVGLLADPQPAPPRGASDKQVPLISFETEEDARESLDSGDIQAYYVLSQDYYETRKVQLVYSEKPGENATRQFWDFMQINLAAGYSPEIAYRAATGTELIRRSPDGESVFYDDPTLDQVFPLIAGFALIFVLMSASGTLLEAVVEEKENRTMEILVTSVSPNQLMSGKILGIVGVNLTLMIAWSGFAALAVFIAGNYLGIAWFQNPSLDVGTILMMLAILIPEYVMVSALATALGATMVDVQESQQVMGILVQPFMIPMYLMAVIMPNPNSPLAVGMSLLPVTAPLTVAIRATFGQLPLWQIAASAAIQSACALGAVWLAGKAFRLGMLRYGQRLSLRELFRRPEPQSLPGGSR